jgi:hypothetical protein
VNRPTRRVGVAGLICLATVLMPIPSIGRPAAGTAEGNAVTAEGTIVTISVRVDLSVRDELVNDENRAAIVELQGEINDYWNTAFEGMRYRDCLTLKLDLVLALVPHSTLDAVVAPGQYVKTTTTPGHHVIGFAVGSQDAPSYLPRPVVVDPYGPAAVPGQDYVSPYQHDLDGTWSEAMDTRDFAHEVGHLLGLGDDYQDVPGLRQSRGSVGVGWGVVRVLAFGVRSWYKFGGGFGWGMFRGPGCPSDRGW